MLFPAYKYRKLTPSDTDDALLLFAYSCRHDPYYTEYFGKPSVETDILETFPEDINNIIKYGHTIGCFHKNKLVGILLGFGIQDWLHNHRSEYYHFFGDNGDEVSSWVQLLVPYLNSRKETVLYLPIICVKGDYRCQGIATNLVSRMCKQLGERYAMVSDATHERAMPMWLSNGFRELMLNKKVKVVIK